MRRAPLGSAAPIVAHGRILLTQGLSGTAATAAALPDMNTRDPQKSEARKAVADRLRQVFARLTEQLSEGAEELWKRVEGKLRGKGQSD
jgi:hypothetical protein